MLKPGDKVTVHFINHWNYQTPTEDTPKGYLGIAFDVKEINGKLGIDGNTNRSPYTCRGELFTPFSVYAWTVIFKDESGRLYRYSDIVGGLEEVTDVKDGYIDKIKWLEGSVIE